VPFVLAAAAVIPGCGAAADGDLDAAAGPSAQPDGPGGVLADAAGKRADSGTPPSEASGGGSGDAAASTIDAAGGGDAGSESGSPDASSHSAGGQDAGSDVGSDASRGPSDAGADGGILGFDPCPAAGDCKVLPLGDSITYGSTSNNGGYRVELFTRAIADQKHITFVGSQSDGPTTVAGASFPRNNEGHPGWTISQIAGIATASNALKDSPPIVLLHIGTNDIPNSLSGSTDRLAQLVDQIVAALPDSLLIVAQIIPLPWAESSVVTYNAAIPSMVQQRANQGKHVIMVDMNTGFPAANGYASDNIHPNDAVGYPWMGDQWYEAIKPYLH
jgi:hypothetical protein